MAMPRQLQRGLAGNRRHPPSRRTLVKLIACLALSTTLTACVGDESSPPEGLFFPTVARQEMYPAALLEGRLEQRFGCLLGSTGGKRGVILLWPDGYVAARFRHPTPAAIAAALARAQGLN